MHCLFIDIASHDGLLACITEDRVVASQAIDHRIGDHQLIPFLEKVLKEAGWTYPDLTQIACVVGPGGFTSLRVGAALANTLSSQLKIPSAGVHLSDLYKARASGAEDRDLPLQKDYVWLHSTKKDLLFICGFGTYAKKFPEPTLITTDDFRSTSYQLLATSWCGELIPEHMKLMQEPALALQPFAEILPSFLKTLSFQKTQLLPWYGRQW